MMKCKVVRTSQQKVKVYKRTIVTTKPKTDIFMPEPWSRVEKYKKVKVKNEYAVS